VIDRLTAFRLARSEFERRLDAVADDQWALPTPCPEWDVTALVRHVIDGDTFATLLLEGSSLHHAITALMAMDDSREFSREADALDAAFAAASPEQTVDHPVGETAVGDFLEFRATDYAGHAWDLARATGQDEALDRQLLSHLWARSEQRLESYTSSEHYGGGSAADRSTAGSDLQTRWLDRIGRPT
jgi:uncharacterized protein (TIGR03086 family)